MAQSQARTILLSDDKKGQPKPHSKSSEQPSLRLPPKKKKTPNTSYCSSLSFDSISSGSIPWIMRRISKGKTNLPIPHLDDKIIEKLWNEKDGTGFGQVIDAAAALAKTHPRGMCTFNLARKRALLITKPYDVKQLMAFNEHKLRNEDSLGIFAKGFYPGNIFDLPRSDEWRQQRTLFDNHIYQVPSLQKLTTKIQQLTDHYIRSIEADSKDAKDGLQIDLERQFASPFTLDVIGKELLGLQDFSLEEKDDIGDTISEVMVEVANPKVTAQFYIQQKYLCNKVSIHLDTLTADGLKQLKQIITKNLDHLQQPETESWLKLIAQRENKKNADEFKKRSSFAHFKKCCSRPKPVTLDSDRIAREAAMMLTVGHETTAKLVQSLFMLLADHPDVQNKVRKEIEEVSARVKRSPANFTYDDFQQLTYLFQVIKETLRLYPPVPIIKAEVATQMKSRETKQDGYVSQAIKTVKDTLGLNSPEITFSVLRNSKQEVLDLDRKDQYEHEMAKPDRDKKEDVTMSGGDMVFMAPYVTQSLEETCPMSDVYPPHKFIPERHENDSTPHPYQHFPFGFSPRECIGQRLAILEAMIATVRIVPQYDIKLPKGMHHPFETQKIFSSRHMPNVPLIFTKRKDAKPDYTMAPDTKASPPIPNADEGLGLEKNGENSDLREKSIRAAMA